MVVVQHLDVFVLQSHYIGEIHLPHDTSVVGMGHNKQASAVAFGSIWNTSIPG